MKPELITAWQNLDNAINEVLAAKSVELSKAAIDLAQARHSYEQELLGGSALNIPSNGLISDIKSIVLARWERFRRGIKEAEKRGKASLLRVTYYAIVLVALCGFLFNALYGSAVSLGYLVTAVGLILVALSQLLTRKFLQDLATLAGIVLVGWWYVHTLPTGISPIKKLLLDAEPLKSGYHVIVAVDDGKESCDFASDTSTLNCKVHVAKIISTPPKE